MYRYLSRIYYVDGVKASLCQFMCCFFFCRLGMRGSVDTRLTLLCHSVCLQVRHARLLVQIHCLLCSVILSVCRFIMCGSWYRYTAYSALSFCLFAWRLLVQIYCALFLLCSLVLSVCRFVMHGSWYKHIAC
jgi:hypothetical protein